MTVSTVGQLRRLLAASDLPDDAPILVPARDHSYREAKAVASTAMYHEDCGYMEDWGEANSEPEPGEKPSERVLALIVGR